MKDEDLERLSAGMKFAKEHSADMDERAKQLLEAIAEYQRRQIDMGMLPEIDNETKLFMSESGIMSMAVLSLAMASYDRHFAAPLAGIARALASMCISQGLERQELMRMLNEAMDPTFNTITPEVVNATNKLRRPQ